LVFGITNREHRTRLVANDVLGDASREQMFDAAAPVSSHRDQINLLCPCVPNDFFEAVKCGVSALAKRTIE
jgi:hypothetical protein